jgi:sugar lactone lactonase YvrE
MSTSKTGLGGKLRSAALGLLATTSLALLLLLVGGSWSPALAVGPALWFASPQLQNPTPVGVGGLIELRPGQLLASGTPHQVQIVESAEPLANSVGLAFQANGSLWVCTLNNTVLKLTFSQLQNLANVPDPAPKVTITSTAFVQDIGCSLDANGNLWVIDAANAIHEISRAQLIAATTAGGTFPLTPQVTITSTDLNSPSFGAFDAAGNLWVTSLNNSKLVEFSASQLGTGGAKLGSVVISSTSLNGPGQPQFDASGNLWVTNSGNNTVVKFTPAQLTASGAPLAAAIIGDDGHGSLVTPWACAIDSLGRLWVFNYGTASSTTTTVVMYGRGMVAASGLTSPTPRRTLSGLPPFGGQAAFGPRY